MKASINGQQRELPDGLTLAGLLEHLGREPLGIAIAKNDRVIKRSTFPHEPVCEGDRIEIIKAVAGG